MHCSSAALRISFCGISVLVDWHLQVSTCWESGQIGLHAVIALCHVWMHHLTMSLCFSSLGPACVSLYLLGWALVKELDGTKTDVVQLLANTDIQLSTTPNRNIIKINNLNIFCMVIQRVKLHMHETRAVELIPFHLRPRTYQSPLACVICYIITVSWVSQNYLFFSKALFL